MGSNPGYLLIFFSTLHLFGTLMCHILIYSQSLFEMILHRETYEVAG